MVMEYPVSEGAWLCVTDYWEAGQDGSTLVKAGQGASMRPLGGLRWVKARQAAALTYQGAALTLQAPSWAALTCLGLPRFA
ncbi:hypothetical protein ACLB2K_043581 [Fragaria x ananassa]